MDTSLAKIFSTVKNSYIPAFMLGLVAFWNFSNPFLPPHQNITIHLCFFALCFLTLLFLFLVNRTKGFFALLTALGVYIAVNRLKLTFGNEYNFSATFQIMLVFFPLDWILFMFWKFGKLRCIENFYLFCILLLEAVLAESVWFVRINSLPLWCDWIMIGSWLLSFLCLYYRASRRGTIKSCAMFFAFICFSLGMFNAENSGALSLYFSAGAGIVFVSSLQDYIYNCFRDGLTGVYSRRSYERRSEFQFPLKYSLGVICIDNYAKLVKIFGKSLVDDLVVMVVSKIKETECDMEIYRYTEDEFVLIFKNEDKKQSYEYLENIRRRVAASEFVLKNKKIVKITISAGVSEKKRSDSNAGAVLVRTRGVLQKAYRFTQNMTSQA